MYQTKNGWILAVTMAIACATTEPDVSEASASDLERTKGRLATHLQDLATDAGVSAIAPPPAADDDLFELGRMLMHDKILSGNRDVSCSTCHLEGGGTDDDLALSIGTGGTGIGADRELGVGRPYVARSAPSLYNLHTTDVLFADGRVRLDPVTGTYTTPAGTQLTADMTAVFTFGALSAQAMFPATGKPEMRGNPGENELADVLSTDFTGMWAALMVRLGAIPEYVTRFEDAYPGTLFADMSFAHAANALAAYQATAFASADSRFDDLMAGTLTSMTRRELQGGILFFSTAGCAACHNGPTLSDNGFHNTALAQFGPGKGDGPTLTDDFGRERVTHDVLDRYAFRTPMLRNVALSGPYGHTGEYRNLESFVAHYEDPENALLGYDVTVEVDDPAHHATLVANAVEVNAAIDPGMFVGQPVVALDEHRKIAAFLETLNGAGVAAQCNLVPATVPSGLPVDLGPCAP